MLKSIYFYKRKLIIKQFVFLDKDIFKESVLSLIFIEADFQICNDIYNFVMTLNPN